MSIPIIFTDKTNTDEPRNSTIMPITINLANPGAIDIGSDILGKYLIEDIQIAPIEVYTFSLQGCLDGTAYVNLIADVVRTGAETEILVGTCGDEGIHAHYKTRIVLTTTSVTDITLWVAIMTYREGDTRS